VNTGKAIIGLGVWLALCLAAGGIGSLFTPGEWYAALAKPDWTPPGVVFAPVWTALYVLMAIAAWLVWRQAGFARALIPLAVFIDQLLLNALWSFLFFGQQQPFWALVDIIALWLAILATSVLFSRVRPIAGALLLPYLGWVTFAAALNFEIWRLNG
jgi:tryptophan-rich sensory protein